MAPSPLPLAAYRGLTGALAPVAPLWLAWRATRGKEEWPRHRERYGFDREQRPFGPVLWCHAASVGESLAVIPLLAAISGRKTGSVPAWHIVLTTGTVTSARLVTPRLPPGAVHRYVPLDHRRWVARFLDHWRPELVLWSESELWPNILAEIAAREIPAVLVNGRLSDKAFRGWQQWPQCAGFLVRAFRRVLAQSPEDARRYDALGAADVRAVGNLKLAAAPLPVDQAALAAFTSMIAGRTPWLGASIHPGEHSVAANIHRALKANHPGLLTILVPRHPPKAAEMSEALAQSGLSVAMRSRGDPIGPETDVYIADTIGELGLFYRACRLVFMGKSFAVGGGQNPAEPALLGCAVILGPDMSNFRDMTDALLAANAAIQVDGPEDLQVVVDRLLANSAERRALGDRASAFMAAHGQGLSETLTALEPFLTMEHKSHSLR